MDSVYLVVTLGAVIAGFVQGLSGFAFGLVAMSFWAWVLDPRLAATLAVFGPWSGRSSPPSPCAAASICDDCCPS